MNLLRELYLSRRFFILLLSGVLAFIMAFVFPVLFDVVVWGTCLFVLALVVEILLLFRSGNAMLVVREMTDKLSNGDENPVAIRVESRYRFPVYCRVADEVPVQFQYRGPMQGLYFPRPGSRTVGYCLRPVRRGEYEFGKVRVFVTTRVGLAERRFSFGLGKTVPVYPSFISMRKYELMAMGNRQSQTGAKRIRVAGVSTFFDQIKPYVMGDDPRTVNWKATAKCNRLMVNTYTEERSQPVYCLIDKGRTMQSPFCGMTMLDYAINAALALSDVVLKKGDRAGLLDFANAPGTFIKADSRHGQLNKINEALYNQRTHFLETDFEQLYITAEHYIHGRSLLILFTNFNSVGGMKRHLPALRRLADRHLLLLVLFEDAETGEVLEQSPSDLHDIYFQTVAAGFMLEKNRIVAELRHYGILSVLTRPEKLTVNVINAYLELKERNRI